MNYPAKVDGLLEGMDVLSELLTNRQDTSFLIAGDGAYYDLVESKAQQLPGDIRTVGFVSDIHGLYEMADVFVHFSHLDGYPSTVLESYAYQVPVVANDEVGMSEQIEDGETGLLVDLNDQNGTVGKVNTLLDDPELRNKLARNGYERVTQNNTKEVIGKKMKSFLSKYAS
jgi:glycosyltransferase involved in cell wall biosynthesis